ncbi:MAG: legume lectin beta domain protein [Cytophagaceae bacterium]|jgi:hypothetical protein|nr:legume lectin beta domain protein [Cytophagaceae bacterium]
MDRFLLKSIAFIVLLVGSFETLVQAQCTSTGTVTNVTPTTTYQTATIVSAYPLQFNATAGVTYTFTFCAGGGVAPGFNGELSAYNAATNANYAYNDDFCGVNPQITFMSPITGAIKVLLSQSRTISGGCAWGTDFGNKTIAYRITSPVNDNICGAYFLYSNRCTLSYATYGNANATTSPQAAPACGSFTGRDVWFKTVVPSSGYLNIGTQSGGITDAAIAAYRASSCSSALTLLGCDYDGAGNMPELPLTSLTPGDSIYVRVWSFNNAQAGTFGIGLSDPYPNYCMMGSAVELNNAGKCLRITPDSRSQLSAVWSTAQINMNVAFDYTYSVNLGSNDAGADGLTFTLQNNAAGTSAIGSPGYNLGIGPLTNTFIVEFDTYDNGAGQSDIPADHVAINVNGNFATPVAGPVQAAASANIEDGTSHNVRITWNPATTVFSVFFDDLVTPKLTYTNDIINNVFGGNSMVYWGVTGSTGSFTNEQSMCPGNLPGATAPLPVTWISFDVAIQDNLVNLSWETGSEKGTKEFIIERSVDGNAFLPIGNQTAQGNSNGLSRYLFIDENPLRSLTYYRLKQVDLNGDYSYSIIRNVSPLSMGNHYSIYPNPSSLDKDLLIDLTEDATIEVYDNANVLMFQQNFVKGVGTINLSDKHLKGGMYYVLMKSASSVDYAKLILTN